MVSGRRQAAGPVFRAPRVVIVGNGPSVTRWDLGGLIDQCDEIVRFNDFVLRGYEKHTGHRTTIWVHSRPKIDGVPPRGCQVIRLCSSQDVRKHRTRNVTAIAREAPGFNWPSAGIVLAQHFVRQGITPYIIGLDAYAASGRRRYWAQELATPDGHDPELEVQRIIELANRRLIKPLENGLR